MVIIEGIGQFTQHTDQVRQAAREAGRQLPDPFPQSMLVSALVLRPGETLASERVVEAIGAEVMAFVHYWWEALILTGQEPAIPDQCRDVWDLQFKQLYARASIPGRRAAVNAFVGGHCPYLREVTSRSLRRALALIRRIVHSSSGRLVKIIAHLRAYETAGVDEVVVLCPTAASREVYTDIREQSWIATGAPTLGWWAPRGVRHAGAAAIPSNFQTDARRPSPTLHLEVGDMACPRITPNPSPFHTSSPSGGKGLSVERFLRWSAGRRLDGQHRASTLGRRRSTG